MKSNKKHHGHVNPNSKQKQPNKQLNQPTNSQPNLALDANNTKQTNTASVAQDSKQTKIVTNNEDENLPVVSDDQTIANIINEENEEANKHVPLEPADDLTLQNKEKEKELLANQETNSTPVHKEVKINAIAKPKKLGIVIVEHNAQTKIKELMIAIESAQGFSNEDVNVYIWDDYSTDNTRAYVAGLSKRFEIHYILNENQEGVVCARNNMLNYVNDDYLIFVDYRDELVIPALTEFFQHYNKNDFMMLRRNIMHSMSKQIVDAGVYHDKGSKSATYLTRTPYSFVTGIFVAKSIYQKVRELINQNYEYAKDIRFYEDMVVYPFWVYYSKTPCFLDSYYNYNIMGHDWYLLTDVCKEEQHQNSLKAIYAIDKLQKDAGIHDDEFTAMKYVMDIRLINTYFKTASMKERKDTDKKVQELINEFIKPVTNAPALIAKDKNKLQFISNGALQKIYRFIHK